MGSGASRLPREGPQPGDTIDGKYLLIGVLGVGGMGVVFEAEHLRLKQRCAIKMLSPEMLCKSEIVHRFEREARASALLKSPHVTRVTDVATTLDGVPYIVMELMTGRDLDSELSARGRLPYEEAVDYVLQACAAVAEAHAAGIIHRDLKPGNLFLAKQEDECVIVKVLDFGISKMIADESKLTVAGMMMGTALYMSPEQLRSAAKVDARSDIWSLGVILYELVLGDPPFVGNAPQIAAAIVSEDAPDITTKCPVPLALGEAIHRTLRRAPDERFQTVGELAAALVPFAPPESVGAAVAALIARRAAMASSPGLATERAASTSTSTSTARPVDVDARTIAVESSTVARDVSTSVSHEVNTAARNEKASRRTLVALIGVVVVLFMVVAGGVLAVVLRGAPPPGPPPAAARPPPTGDSSSAVESASSRAGAPSGESVATGTSAPGSSGAASTASGTAPGAKPPAFVAGPRPPRVPTSGGSSPPPSPSHSPSPSSSSSPPKKPPGAPSALAPAFL